MPVIKELIRKESDGTISFGNYELPAKTKLQDFEHNGDLYKVKTFKEITKLEKNGLFVYESVPGTAVSHFNATENGISFVVEGSEDAQVTIGVEESTEYRISINGIDAGVVKTNLSGKLVLSVELAGIENVAVKVEKA